MGEQLEKNKRIGRGRGGEATEEQKDVLIRSKGQEDEVLDVSRQKRRKGYVRTEKVGEQLEEHKKKRVRTRRPYNM